MIPNPLHVPTPEERLLKQILMARERQRRRYLNQGLDIHAAITPKRGLTKDEMKALKKGFTPILGKRTLLKPSPAGTQL